MAGEWKDLTLSDLGRIVTGKTPPTAFEANFGGEAPFVTPSDMDGRRIISETSRSLTELGVASVKGSWIPSGSVMVSCIGSDMGKAAIPGRDCVTNQQINSIVVDGHFSSDFVYYNLSTRKNEIRHQAAGGSAQPILNKGDFSQLSISLPPLPIQRRIAHILGTLDDKIELNRRMNATLEEMARAIFKSWFVDFDPVHENMWRRQSGTQQHPANAFEPTAQAVGLDSTSRSGGGVGMNPPTGVGGSKTGGSHTGGPQFAKTNEGPYPNDEPTAQAVGLDSTSRSGGGFGMNPPTGVGGSTFGFSVPPDVAALFPDSFEDSELGRIPKGWKVDTIKNRASNIQYGFTQSATDQPIGPHFLRITDIRGGKIEWGSVPFCTATDEDIEKYRIFAGDILVARTGASTGENVYIVEPPYAVFASYLIRIQFASRAFGRMTGEFMRSADYANYVSGTIGGSAQPNASAQVLAAASMIFPTEQIANSFYNLVNPLDMRRSANDRESRTLATLRDTLLPKLLSGELRVPDAEKIVERTV